MAANLNGDNEWVRYENATCLIETRDSQGTGFFFGEGWVMSVAHNFQNDDTDSEQLHTLLSETRFRFTVNGTLYDFHPRRRMAFIHHLQPGENIDPSNMDIAMVKLGKQYEYVRSNFEQWEMDEQDQLDEMNLGAVFATMEMNLGAVFATMDRVHAIHYAGEEPDVVRLRTDLTVTNMGQNPDIQGIPIMKLQPALQPGASGCPIINENFKLVGLLVGGGEVENPDARDEALMWNHGIQQYISTGVSIIAGIDGYMAHRNAAINQPQADLSERHEEIAEDERLWLVEISRNARLTIYLMNGDVINGPQANNN